MNPSVTYHGAASRLRDACIALRYAACASMGQRRGRFELAEIKRGQWQSQSGILGPRRDGEIQLEGDWKFQWRAFLEPSEISRRFAQLNTTLEVPGLWRESDYPLHGYGTYALRVSDLPNDSLAHDAAHYLSRDALRLRRD